MLRSVRSGLTKYAEDPVAGGEGADAVPLPNCSTLPTSASKVAGICVASDKQSYLYVHDNVFQWLITGATTASG